MKESLDTEYKNHINLLSEHFLLGKVELANRIVMAPLTRCRATEGQPNDLMVEYYRQRASAGLIISEGTSPSVHGQGYARMPGIYTHQHVEGWKKVTSAVHERGGKIFVQLMHSGRVGHTANLPRGGRILSPSGVSMKSKKMFVDEQGLLPIPQAETMTKSDVEDAIDAYVHASLCARDAGFDGVELHGANGYLIEQFLNPLVNCRQDEFGGSRLKRFYFLEEIICRIRLTMPSYPMGLRISPFSTFNEMPAYADADETYLELARRLNRAGLTYLHIVDHTHWGMPKFPAGYKRKLKDNFGGPVILCGAFNALTAGKAVKEKNADLVAFGRPYVSNPDLYERILSGSNLNVPNTHTFYTPGATGYTDYSFLPTSQ